MSKLAVSKPALGDIAERVGFVTAYAAVSEVAVQLADLEQGWVLIIMPALAALKGWLATKVGDPDTGSVRRKAAR